MRKQWIDPIDAMPSGLAPAKDFNKFVRDTERAIRKGLGLQPRLTVVPSTQEDDDDDR